MYKNDKVIIRKYNRKDLKNTRIKVETKEIKTEQLKPENRKNSAKDEIIRRYIKEHFKTSNLFSDNQKIFF